MQGLVEYRAVSRSVVILAIALACPVHAQRAPAWSLGVGAGVGASHTSTPSMETAAAFPVIDLTFALRPRPSGSPFVFGVNATGTWVWPGGDVCAIAPDGSCLPPHDGFMFFGVLGGWESRRARLRVLGGPAFALSSGPRPAFALQSRLEGAIPIAPHLSFTGSLRGALVPNYYRGPNSVSLAYRRATYSLVGAGIGLRVHGR